MLQVIVVMTDGNYQPDEDPIQSLIALEALNVTIFSVGIGVWLQTGSVRSFASKSRYYGTQSNWTQLVTNTVMSSVGHGKCSVSLAVHASIRPPVRSSIYPFIRPSVCPYVKSSISLSIRPSVRPFVMPSVYTFTHSSVRPFVPPNHPQTF